MNGKLKALAGICATGIALAAAAPAQATDFPVTNLNDDPEEGSLRFAINSANSSNGLDTITFAPNLNGTIIAQSPFAITDTVDIIGPGENNVTVSGSDEMQVFTVTTAMAGAPVSISGLTIADGLAFAGGAINNNNADLTLSEVVVTDSSAGFTGVGGRGGGVASAGPLTISNSEVTSNTANDGSGGSVGGGIYISGMGSGLTVTDSVISGNDTSNGQGGGIGLQGPTAAVTITDSTVAGNGATDGAGIHAANPISPVFEITRSTVSENTANALGGGLLLLTGTVAPKIVNSTISGNTAGGGGGIRVDGTPPLTIRASTIANNNSLTASGGGGINRANAAVNAESTVVSGNTGAVGPNIVDATAPLVTQSFAFDHSLIESTTGAVITDGGNNIIGANPLLGPLAENGGPTRTHLPAPNSPLIDKGKNIETSTDQRGVDRLFDFPDVANAPGSDAADIGAVERNTTADPLADPGIVGGRDPASGYFCGTARATIVGSPGKDKLNGTAGRDVIRGLGGDDVIRGLGGNDVICGDKGNDKVRGNGGDDELRGGDGRDSVNAAGGDDVLRGGSGPDRLFGQGGNDQLFGGSKAGGAGESSAAKPLAKGGGANLCDGGAGTDKAEGCEITRGIP